MYAFNSLDVVCFRLSNYGFNDVESTDKNKLTVAVVFMVIIDPGVNEGDEHKLIMNVASTGVHEKNIVVAAAQPFPVTTGFVYCFHVKTIL